MGLLLKNLHCYANRQDWTGDLRIRRGRIAAVEPGLIPRWREQVLDGSGYVALPGWINAHDHLEMNLYPRLGTPPYADMYAWAEDVHHPETSPIHEILQVAMTDRLRWGGYKNLISGATTVVHHNAYHRRAFGFRFPVKVLKQYEWSHSLGFGDDVAGDFARSNEHPYVIHAAEGVSAAVAREIDVLENLGVLASNTVLAHGIALSQDHIRLLSERGVSVVWCPSSNLFLYGKTAPVERLRGNVSVTLGTDSTLSGAATLWEELRVARDTGRATPAELLEMVTTRAASSFRLDDGRGTLRVGAPADVLLVPDRGASVPETVIEMGPADLALVLVDGKPRLANSAFAEQLGVGPADAWIDGSKKWLFGNVEALRRRIRRTAGEAVLSSNPLWRLFAAPEPVLNA